MFIVRRVKGDPAGKFMKAKLLFPQTMSKELDGAGVLIKATASAIAPVYDPLKYPDFARFEHAIESTMFPARLKETLFVTPVRHIYRFFKFSLVSPMYYALFIERGFRHHLSKRFIRGRFFMRSSVRGVMGVLIERVAKRALDFALKG